MEPYYTHSDNTPIYKYIDFEEDERLKQHMYRPWNPLKKCFSCQWYRNKDTI